VYRREEKWNKFLFYENKVLMWKILKYFYPQFMKERKEEEKWNLWWMEGVKGMVRNSSKRVRHLEKGTISKEGSNPFRPPWLPVLDVISKQLNQKIRHFHLYSKTFQNSDKHSEYRHLQYKLQTNKNVIIFKRFTQK